MLHREMHGNAFECALLIGLPHQIDMIYAPHVGIVLLMIPALAVMNAMEVEANRQV